MYLSFFGLNEKPFAITPDPRYLFLSERHGEGLAHLVYGVTESGGFIQLTGEVGTGKTTLVRTLLAELPEEVDIALVLNPELSTLEFLRTVCEELDVELPPGAAGSKALVDALNRHLLAAHARGRRTVLLVDEAQNLSRDVLEQLRLLTNLETAKQKLLQIILIGQPELRALLAQDNLRQLAQRVTGRYHLEPLSRDEALAYIDHRLRVAGSLADLFEPAAKREVYRLSGGIPRLVNIICDRALLGAYSEESRRVTRSIVRRAAAEVAGRETRRARWWRPLSVATTVLAAMAAAWWWPAVKPLSSPPPVSLPAADAAEAGEEQAAAAHAGTATDPPAPPRLRELLAETRTTLPGSLEGLFRLWGVDPEGEASCAAAAAEGLGCLSQRGSFNVLEQLDRPAVLTLIDEQGGRHYVVLTGLAGDRATVAVGDSRVEVGLEEIGELWFGDYLLVWRPPTGRVEALRPGSRGDSVRWLRESLARLDGEPAAEGDLFDAALESRLRSFQRRHRLEVDGLAGQQTQILINSLLASENTPRLSGGER